MEQLFSNIGQQAAKGSATKEGKQVRQAVIALISKGTAQK